MSRISTGSVVYPDSDGKPMAENTLQYQWIVYFRENIAERFAGRPDVLVAADNLIYPVEGEPSISIAPDVYVAIGRPAGHRGSYRVWAEGNLFPQVVIEVLSPGNTVREMNRKRQFYRRYGAEEYYVYDPDDNVLRVWVRDGRRLVEVGRVNGWTSPRLGIRFDTSGPDQLVVYGRDGRPFVTFHELSQQLETERNRADEERRRADDESRRADDERARAEAERRRAAKLAAKLRELGVDPTTL